MRLEAACRWLRTATMIDVQPARAAEEPLQASVRADEGEHGHQRSPRSLILTIDQLRNL